MRSLGFLLSRRWALFAVAIGVVAYGTWWLGEWQFGRLEDRKADNAVIRANEDKPPAPVAEVLAPGEPVSEDDEWRVVSATGSYAPEDTVIVRYRTRDSASGIDVVVPLVTTDGTTLLVDRGWLATDNRGGDEADIPDPPAGEVTVTGYVRADGTGASTEVDDMSTRAVNSEVIGEAIGREVFTGWVELRSEDPPPAQPLEPVELPELDNGPHFFYGLQWWFFGVLGLGGFGYLIWDEWRRTTGRKRGRPAPGQSTRSMPPSTGSITPETNEAAGESRKAATRPNSSGSP
ncbi:SURF1 family protein [Nocardioides ferulae]|uniref:SURF1 family cytochrome oxidase biogenesis protein n=1 Tax=Nocardioides ferulae TaxID=2340821 RepID=UPI000EAE2604|nr:SURF1 family protein [Nocardioides ferulae]